MRGLRDILLFQVNRVLNATCKNFLVILEGIWHEHDSQFEKLRAAIPKEYHNLITQAEFLDSKKYSYLRKLVLDRGGDANRELQTEIEKFEIGVDDER
jgi:hypothetical protein